MMVPPKARAHAEEMLRAVRSARGPDWKPSGSVAEGDVRQKMFDESGFLNVFEQQWNGSTDGRVSYAALDHYLRRLHPAPR